VCWEGGEKHDKGFGSKLKLWGRPSVLDHNDCVCVLEYWVRKGGDWAIRSETHRKRAWAFPGAGQTDFFVVEHLKAPRSRGLRSRTVVLCCVAGH
jgi:hypothetical protein